MCGITGIVSRNELREEMLRRMTDTLSHRGPDDAGTVLLPPTRNGWQAGLGHRRLSIIDLSPAGHQPMSTADEQVWITFNGEIYNYQEIRTELQELGYAFRSGTDTEVLLHGWRAWGVELLPKLNGMFAFGLWDRSTDTLLLTRDRFGKKPLHYRLTAEGIAFASELKAFAALPDFSPMIEPTAVSRYLAFEYVPAPHTILAGVNRLSAGSYLLWRNGNVEVNSWWNISFPKAPAISMEDAEERIVELLRESIRRRLMSDVPLGVFLSGGIDSGAIVALLSELMPASQIKTFSIGFAEKSFDESSHARHIARVFGTEHHEQILTPDAMPAILPEVLNLLDEPFADASIVPTYLLSKFTRQHVTVALGGDGGDELFAGYDPFLAHTCADFYERIPEALHRNVLAPLANRLPVSTRNMSFDFRLKHFMKGVYTPPEIRNQLWLGAVSPQEQRELLTPAINRELAGFDPFSEMQAAAAQQSFRNPLDRIAWLYQKYYLADDILVKIDRASMMVSLEARSPFLDVACAEFANSLSSSWKMRLAVRKYILKRALIGRLPHDILYRPKKGFGIPLAQWFKHELRDELTRTLAPDRLAERGLFRPEAVQRLLDEHMKGLRDHRKPLWALYVFEKVRARWEGA